MALISDAPILRALVEHVAPARKLAPAAEKAFAIPVADAARMAGDRLTLSPGTRMASVARQLLGNLKETEYAHESFIDAANGVVKTDCSGLIDYLAKRVDAHALDSIPVDAGFDHPRAWDMKRFFDAQPLADAGKSASHWGKVARPADLSAGDVIAWENVGFKPGENTGHVMLVSGRPAPVQEAGGLKGFDVPIIDSTSHGHGASDPRVKGQGGLGQGSIFVPVDAQGAASGFSWAPSTSPDGLPLRAPSLSFGRLLPAS